MIDWLFRGRAAAVATLAVLALCAAGCAAGSAGATGDGGGGHQLSVVAYSVPKPAYDALENAFAATAQGKGVSWASSYGASGTQAQAVLNGQKADYVAFSLEPDMTKLVPKFVANDWKSGPTKGLVSDSVVVIAVRKGNPKHITGWDDLIKPGTKIVTPDPGSSGSAKWNVLAAYAHVLQNGGTDAEAADYLTKFFGNVVSKPSSGANATSTFLNGTGDVLISYENEAIAARQKGEPLDYIVPAQTLLIENPAAVTKSAPQQAKDFLQFVESEAGQRIFASHGYRPVLAEVKPGTVEGANDPANPFPTVAKLETIKDLGGWSAVNTKFFDKTSGLITKIESGQG
jgi:sulfate/thiosulfate transport system substrate-binding protein